MPSTFVNPSVCIYLFWDCTEPIGKSLQQTFGGWTDLLLLTFKTGQLISLLLDTGIGNRVRLSITARGVGVFN